MESVRWAQGLAARRDWVVLDTETTGTRHLDEVVQVAVVDSGGTVLLDTLVRPAQPIPPDATRIHGIDDARVASAPRFGEIRNQLQAALAGKTVIAYNAEFDSRLLTQTAFLHRVPLLDARWECAMKRYSAFVGHWSERHGNYAYVALPRKGALAGRPHDALADCQATRELILEMAWSG
jgi:DNA polymerase III subunit epsilon